MCHQIAAKLNCAKGTAIYFQQTAKINKQINKIRILYIFKLRVHGIGSMCSKGTILKPDHRKKKI